MSNVSCGLTTKKPRSSPCPTLVIEYETTVHLTQRRSVAKSVGCFQRRLFVRLFVCLFVNMITSERVNVGVGAWYKNLDRIRILIAPLGAHPQCGVGLRRWENQRRLSSFTYIHTRTRQTLTVSCPVSLRMLNTFAAGELSVDGAKL